jgi:hypothetical protein
MKTQATTRPTAAQLQAINAKNARRQAALDRRAENAAGIETETQQTRRLYANVGR